MKKYIANIVTGCRVFLSILMLFISVLSLEFYFVYLLCGLSDMIDGTIARKSKSISEFGAKFDTVADLLFTIVSFIKLLPVIYLPKWLCLWITTIAIIKIFNLMWGFIYKKKLVSIHTLMNKVTGFLLFLLPLTLFYIDLKYSSIVVCATATYSVIQEWNYINIGREFIK